MNQDILLSKIVSNATDTAWAQAYTTLNVYITLSIENAESKSVTTHGKELLEKLQREFFALDDKSLENIKKAVENVAKTIEKGYTYSILVGAIVGDVLYIVIASEGQVVIKRGNRTGSIAVGVENELHGFSGKLKHDDIIIFETGDFAKKIPVKNLSEQLNSHSDVSQIAENITPLIHDDSKGTEGAIILQYKDLTGVAKHQDFVIDEEEDADDQKKEEEQTPYEENLWTKPHENNNIEELNETDDSTPLEEEGAEEPAPQRPFLQLPRVAMGGKKIAIIAVVVILLVVLLGGVAYQLYSADKAKKLTAYNEALKPAREKFDEGVTLSTLNKTLALDDFNASKNLASEALSKFSKGSDEFNKLSDFEKQIDSKISDLGGGSSAKNVKEYLKTGDKLKSITAITAKGGGLVVLDKDGKQVATISDGKVKKTFDIKFADSFLSADDKFIYTMGTGVTSIDRGNGDVKQIIKKVEGDAFDIFGSNVYTLTSKDITKYKAPSYDDASYFADTPSFKATPTDMSISGPVWVLEQDGTVERFTKGKNDNISLSGLAGPIADGAKIYADSDNNNVYIMDVKNQRVVVLNEKGEYQTQYEGSFIKDATSFAIDEKNKIGYVLSGSTVYSFDL